MVGGAFQIVALGMYPLLSSSQFTSSEIRGANMHVADAAFMVSSTAEPECESAQVERNIISRKILGAFRTAKALLCSVPARAKGGIL